MSRSSDVESNHSLPVTQLWVETEPEKTIVSWPLFLMQHDIHRQSVKLAVGQSVLMILNDSVTQNQSGLSAKYMFTADLWRTEGPACDSSSSNRLWNHSTTSYLSSYWLLVNVCFSSSALAHCVAVQQTSSTKLLRVMLVNYKVLDQIQGFRITRDPWSRWISTTTAAVCLCSTQHHCVIGGTTSTYIKPPL